MVKRTANAKNYQLGGKLRFSVQLDKEAARKIIRTEEQRELLEKGLQKTGDTVFIDGRFTYARKNKKSRLDLEAGTVFGSGTSKETGEADVHAIFVSDGKKTYTTLIGSHMDIDEADTHTLSLIFAPQGKGKINYRMLSAVTIDDTQGYPVELLGEDKDQSVRLIYTIEPSTARLLQVEWIFNSENPVTLAFIAASESLTPTLDNDFFKPVLPGKKKVVSDSSTDAPFDVSVLLSSLTKIGK